MPPKKVTKKAKSKDDQIEESPEITANRMSQTEDTSKKKTHPDGKNHPKELSSSKKPRGQMEEISQQRAEKKKDSINQIMRSPNSNPSQSNKKPTVAIKASSNQKKVPEPDDEDDPHDSHNDEGEEEASEEESVASV